MGFFRKLFSSISSSEDVDSKAVELLLNSADFYNNKLPSGFYKKLLEIYSIRTFNTDDSRHIKAYQEFKDQVEILSMIYDQMISSGFSNESLDSFLGKFEEFVSRDYELPGIKSLMASYWYQPIRKTRVDIKNSNKKEVIDSFEEFHTKIRNIMEQIMFLK